ncbi:pulmonary surfactant-associated protein D-like isoform X2 [Oscarella lobularis]|uniref:pulmonary surfactant-associated protein D-like isoform X2 n=1 Tax=Oscarella lobularis TaxID=121494 RepID=UPI003313FBDC
MHWCLLILLSLVSFSYQSEESSTNFRLPKGDKGDRGSPGHPGVRGITGPKGDKGAHGSAGENGPKGDQGAKGSQGFPGKQGPAGVIGPTGPQGATGSQGLRGETGLQGVPGIQGPKGQKGVQGLKGEIGWTGPRGRRGIDGIPGPPGHPGVSGPIGLKGDKGMKGERGLTGHKGQQGLRGIPGPDIDEHVLKRLKKEIVADLKSSLSTILKPIAYLVGDGSTWQTYSPGQVITHWSTRTSGSLPSVVQGGMTYSNGYITVPESGIYFIYSNLYADGLSTPDICSSAIFVDSLRIGFTGDHFESISDRSQHVGMLWNVRKGGRLSVRVACRMKYDFRRDYACFGAWKIN